METRESINSKYQVQQRKYFRLGIYGAVLGIVIGAVGFGRNYYQTGNIPGMHPLSKSNNAIVLTGIVSALGSLSAPIALGIRARRKRDDELESLSNSVPDVDSCLPYSNP